MTDSSTLDTLLRVSRLLRSGAGTFRPESPLRIARPIDAENLVGRHEGRARKMAGGSSSGTLSAALQQRTGPTRGLFARTWRRGANAFDARQRAVVKVHYFGHGGSGGKALRAHARYIARDGVARDGQRTAGDNRLAEPAADDLGQGARDAERTVFYGPDSDGVDGARLAARWAEADRRHFRIILAPENGTRLGDLRSVTREVMTRAERALGARLEWVAVDHWDTDNPHTHIILRGRNENGRDLILPRAFVSPGFRNLARDVRTERLGFRTREDGRNALQLEIRAHRWTRLDQLIAAQVRADGTVRLARLEGPGGAPALTDALKARGRELKRLGLAQEIRRNVLTLDPAWRSRLDAMELHLDVRRSLVRTRAVSLQKDAIARRSSKALGLAPGTDT